jgi:hypothetical protein
MGKYFICAAICLGMLKAGAQHYEEISEKFIQFYNAQKADSLFHLYDPELRQKLTLDKTKTVIVGLHVQFGDLKSLVLLKKDSGFNMYKASFSHQTFTLLLALDSQDLIEGFRFVPYRKEQFPESKSSYQ